MQFKFTNKRITGILGILPEDVYTFEEETQRMSRVRADRLKTVMGYGQRRRAKKTTSTADLCVFGMRKLLKEGYISEKEIGAIIVVSLTPDYFVPHISNIVQGQCKLPHDIICMDIPQGCAGYPLGLMQAFLLLEHMVDKKVVLITGDVMNRKEKEQETFINPPSGGDAATITVVENDICNNEIYMELRTCGEERETLIYPCGGFRYEQGIIQQGKVEVGDGRICEPYEINMDGTAVFNFVQREVPELLDSLFSYANKSKSDIDYYLFHQPNRFMLEKLAEKIEVSKDKMFMNIVEKYGNSNSNTIPLVIADNLSDKICQEEYDCCLAGFGTGLALGGVLMKVGNLDFCEIVTSEL